MTHNDSVCLRCCQALKLLFCMVFVLLATSCGLGYVLSSSYHQMELLRSKVPIKDARASGKLTASQIRALDVIADVRAFGAEIGLSATDNYTEIALEWDRTIWNVSGCQPDWFEPKTWWFPIVGRVPYLGFFSEEKVREKAEEIKADGMDVYVRQVAAYSTLGWFEDPILIPMLDWGEFDLACLVLHELTHATLWLPSDVGFNESFANFVGDVAAARYMAARHGVGSEAYRETLSRRADQKLWRSVRHDLYTDLEDFYTNEGLTIEERLVGKAAIFATLAERVKQAGFNRPEGYLRSAVEGTWNNARMIQFRAYNQDEVLFADVLNVMGGDIVALIFRVGELVDGAEDPRQVLRDFTGASLSSPGSSVDDQK